MIAYEDLEAAWDEFRKVLTLYGGTSTCAAVSVGSLSELITDLGVDPQDLHRWTDERGAAMMKAGERNKLSPVQTTATAVLHGFLIGLIVGTDEL